MSIDLRPEFIRENYEVHEWKYACAILHPDFPNEWDSNHSQSNVIPLKQKKLL